MNKHLRSMARGFLGALLVACAALLVLPASAGPSVSPPKGKADHAPDFHIVNDTMLVLSDEKGGLISDDGLARVSEILNFNPDVRKALSQALRSKSVKDVRDPGYGQAKIAPAPQLVSMTGETPSPASLPPENVMRLQTAFRLDPPACFACHAPARKFTPWGAPLIFTSYDIGTSVRTWR